VGQREGAEEYKRQYFFEREDTPCEQKRQNASQERGCPNAIKNGCLGLITFDPLENFHV